MTKNTKKRSRKGQCLIEMVVGTSLVLVPLCLFGLDLITIVLSNSANDHIAKIAARAAANQKTVEGAKKAAEQQIKEVQTSAIIVNIRLDEVTYPAQQQIAVRTRMEIKLPAPFPGFSGGVFVAQATEPVVGNPVNL